MATGRQALPVNAYSAGNLLWRGEEWRTPTSTERAQAHGRPPAAVKPSYTDKLKGIEAEKTANSAIGNGFHIPSVTIIFIMRFQSATAWPMPYKRIGRAADEERLTQRVLGTVFDDRTLRSTPGLLSPDKCVDQMILLFEEMNFKDKKFKLPWRRVRFNLRLQEAAVMAFQRF